LPEPEGNLALLSVAVVETGYLWVLGMSGHDFSVSIVQQELRDQESNLRLDALGSQNGRTLKARCYCIAYALVNAVLYSVLLPLWKA